MFRYSVTHVLSNRVGINCVNFVGAGHRKLQFKNNSPFRNYIMSGQYSVIERGTPNSTNYRVFLSKCLIMLPVFGLRLHNLIIIMFDEIGI